MKRHSLLKIVLLAGMSFALFSCNSSRHFDRDSLDMEDIYGSAAADTLNSADLAWQDFFGDPQLKILIDEALTNNLDLQVAVKRIEQAEAYFSQSKAALLPSLSVAGQATYVRNSESVYPNGPREANGYQLMGSSSWEIDIWGKLRSAKRAAYANLLQSDAGYKAVQTALVANLATAYYNLVALDEQERITKETVKNNIDLVETMKALQASGRVTGAAVVQSEASRYAAEVTIPDLEQQIVETENTICLLLGRTPGTVVRSSLDEQSVPELMHTGVPAQLLDKRPDVMQAEFAVISAFETTNSARAYFYPALTISASGGFEAVDLKDLLDPGSFAANVLGGLTAPIFAKKSNSTRLKVAQAQQEEALLGLRSTLLNSGAEVSNALASYKNVSDKMALRKLQLDALDKSVEYTKELLLYGSATYTEVLNAQQSLLAAQLSEVNDHVQQLTAALSLYKALGGGWK